MVHNLNHLDHATILCENPPPQTIITKADSGASQHFFKHDDSDALNNCMPTMSGPYVRLPNDDIIQATHFGSLQLHPALSKKASTAHVFDGITNSSLLSLGQLCDDNCIAVLDKNKMQVYKQNTIILSGTRNSNDGLWDIPVPTTSNAKTQPTSHKWTSPSVNAIR